MKIRAAHKDYNARGKCRQHWFRMLWSGTSWEYFGDDRLPNGNFLASDRHATVHGHVEPGDLVAQHDRGGKIDAIYAVIDDKQNPLVSLPFSRRLGVLKIAIPFEAEQRELPDPRK